MTDTAAADVRAQLLRAATALKEMRARLEAAESARREPIAIVGMGCRFPGAASPSELWDLLRSGGDAITEVPSERWEVGSLFDEAPEAAGKVTTRWAGFVSDIDRFDAPFFGISPREADQMDPQQRLLLEVAWEALEDAGRSVDQLAGSDTGVFVGVHSHSEDYYLLQAIDPATLDLYSGTGTSHAVLSGRLSYLLDLRGPSFAIDAACSSSLVAVHLAVQSLRNGECSLAIAGGVNSIIDPTFTMVASRMRIMSPTGRCRPFDAGADGFVRSEGCGAVVLKRLAAAEADGDRVLAVIHGSAVNQDGRSNGLTAPNSLAQQAVITAALADAGVSPSEIDVVEAHGTGTPIGDPIEIEALTAVYGAADGASPRTTALGSIKANIGHTEGAAGVAGLIKMVLSLRAREIAPLVHFTALNPHISLDGTPFVLPTAPMPWPEQGERRRAGISSFGLSGTNVHVIIGDPGPAQPTAGADGANDTGAALLLPISGRSPASRHELAGRYLDLLRTATEIPVIDICATASVRRSHHDHRLAAVGRDRAGLVAALDAFTRGDEHRGLAVGVGRRGADLTVFVFPGQGSQWAGMARDLLRHEPAFRRAIERCHESLAPHVDWSLLEVLDDPTGARLDDIDVVQPVLFALQVALAAMWEAWGVRPDAVVGHSMGEVAAAHVAGALTLDDAARVICIRSRLLRRIAGRGAMAVVDLDVDGARRAIAGVEDRLSIAVSNSRTSTVLSGDPDALDAVMARLERDGTFCRRVRVDVASHSPQVEELLDDLRVLLAPVHPVRASVPFLSTVTGEVVDGAELGASYWADNVRRPVRFADVVDALIAQGHGRFVEMTAHPLLAGSVREALQHASRGGVAVASMHRDCDGPTDLRTALGALYVDGLAVDWTRVQPARPPADLPPYAWQHERYWLGEHDDEAGAGVAELIHTVRWRRAPDATVARPQAVGRWLVVAADGVDAAAHARALGDAAVVALDDASPDEIDALVDHRLAGVTDRVGVVVITGGSDDAPPSATAMAARQCRHVAAIVRLAAALDRRRVAARLWLVTHGAQQVRPDELVPGWVDGTLWGLGRAIGEELPHLWAGCIDLDPSAPPAQGAEALTRELTHVGADGEAEGEVALRDTRRFVGRLVPAVVPAPAPLTIPVDGTVLVTGGFGAVGREVARWLVEQGARRVALLGRTGLPPRAEWAGLDPEAPAGRRVAIVRELEAFGAAVHVAAVDAGDEAALVSFLDTFREEGWPPIRIVVHAAAQFGGDLVGDVGAGAVRAQLLPKLVGAWTFHHHLPDLQHLVLFSSIAGSLPMAGQSAYAAANSFLDSLAQHRAATGRPAVSIAWGFWEGSDEAVPGETGRGHVDGGRTYKDIANTLAVDQGIHGFAVDQGLATLHRLLLGSEPSTVVAAIDWARLGTARIASVAGLTADQVAAASRAVGGTRASSFVAEIADAAPSEQLDVAEAAVRRIVGRVLKLPPDGIDGATPFGSLGMDSLMSVELRNLLERELGSKLSATVAWNYPTVQELAAYLVTRVAGTEAAPAVEAAAPVGADPRLDRLATKVDELSEDEALAALMGGERP